jgi:ABC-type glycerol-3-phosphate transport system substrate-binding protein
MKRTLAAALAAGVLAGAVGCGGSSSSSPPPPGADSKDFYEKKREASMKKEMQMRGTPTGK